jgi:hypothetical protein
MFFRKFGRIFEPSEFGVTEYTHAYIPTPWRLPSGDVRVYFAGRDSTERGRIWFVDLDSGNPRRVKRVAKQPCLDLGPPGSFDEDGVTPISLVSLGNDLFLFYVGWQRRSDVRYSLLTGLAVSNDGGESFHRRQNSQVLFPIPGQTFIRSAAMVTRHPEGFQMWYVGGENWITLPNKRVPTYSIYNLFSDSVYEWNVPPIQKVSPSLPSEIGFGRPWLLERNGVATLLYSIRSIDDAYKIGWATVGANGQVQRVDTEIGLNTSSGMWDSEQTAFVSILNDGCEPLAFFNGNDFGRTGFGIAKMEIDV